MFLKFFAVAKSCFHTFYHITLSCCQLIWMFPVNRREFCIQHRIFFSVRKCNYSLYRIDPVKQTAVFHMKFSVSVDKLSFQLELNDRNCLMHLLTQFFFQCIIIGSSLHLKCITRIIFVNFHGKSSERKHIDSITVFKNIKIAISNTVTQYRCNTCTLSDSSSHPYNIMISPLNIKGMVIHQTIHNKMRTRSTVKNITKNMQMIHNKPLDQFCKRNDKILCTSNLNDRIYNRIIIRFFIQNLCLFRNQFLYHISIIRRKGFTYLGACVF